MAATENRYMIMGYNVEFPQGKRPFPAQLAVMNKVLTALKTGQHALLESPTGSGKTLALLCSTLTFQRQHVKDTVAAQMQQLQDPDFQKQVATKQAQKAQLRAIETQMQLLEAQQQVAMARKARQHSELQVEHSPLIACELSSTQDDVVATQRSGNTSNWKSTRPEPSSLTTESKRLLPQSFACATQETKLALASEDATTRIVAPRIFFCSRTHSQLAQVVQELKTCPLSYQTPLDASSIPMQMCVLGSKRTMCVNRKYNRNPLQVEEKCRVALETASCSFFRKRKSTNDLKRTVPSIWDIEDLVALAQTHRECAYFHARDALGAATIIFAPYNYLLDPTIRNAVGIRVHDAIIVLDEAHNVEETCRASASVEVTHDVLLASIQAFKLVLQHGNRPATYAALLHVLNGLNRWLEMAAKTSLQASDTSHVWDGLAALAMLHEYAGVTTETFHGLQATVDQVREYETALSTTAESRASLNPKHSDAVVLLGALALATVQSILNVVDYMLRDQLKYLDDFKLVVCKTKAVDAARRRGQSPANGTDELKLCIWCLNAAVAFSDLATHARSVILTSGTLSPLDSFAGELGVDFPVRLEANHVVDMRKQVLIGAIMHGPGHVDLQATYTNQHEPRYQDAVGQLLWQYSRAIPGGILMFLPSYALLEALSTRWRKTKVWHAIDALKPIFSEPRHAGRTFDALLDAYRDTIARATVRGDDQDATTTGAIFLAVYRGKVSEGIDFANDNARAVLCVGIPYPSVTELQVSLKRRYQDDKSRSDLRLVNGHVWYNLQAFRALNQALGRCIRHRRDYGAILLLDSRHRCKKHIHSLSKWMRPYVREFEHSQLCVPMFTAFFERNEMELPQREAIRAEARAKRPLVLEYEQDERGKKTKALAFALVATPSTDTKDATASLDGVFSIFRPQLSK